MAIFFQWIVSTQALAAAKWTRSEVFIDDGTIDKRNKMNSKVYIDRVSTQTQMLENGSWSFTLKMDNSLEWNWARVHRLFNELCSYLCPETDGHVFSERMQVRPIRTEQAQTFHWAFRFSGLKNTSKERTKSLNHVAFAVSGNGRI